MDQFEAQNATIGGDSSSTAMSPEQEAIERNFGVPPEPSETAQKPETRPVREPTQAAKPQTAPEEDLPEKYRGKTPGQIAKMHMESEKAMHEAAQAKAEAERSHQSTQEKLTFAEQQRARYEQMLADRARNQAAPETPQPDHLRTRFQQTVNEDPQVYDTINEVAANAAQRALMPHIQHAQKTLADLQDQAFRVEQENYLKSDPEAAKLWPEIQKEATTLFTEMRDTLVRQGFHPDIAMIAVTAMNRDLRFAPKLKAMVKGMKGAEYYQQQLPQTSSLEPRTSEANDAKSHLSGGGSPAPDNTDVGDLPLSEYNKMSSKEQKAYLKSKGLWGRAP